MNRRRDVLAVAIAVEPEEEWTTKRVQRTWTRAGIAAPKRATARAELKRAEAEGLIDRQEQPGRRYYIRRRAPK